MSNDISSVVREWKSKKEKNALKITDTLFILGHYSTLLTQFYANIPKIMMLRSLAELGYQGYKSYVIYKNHDYNSISIVLSGLVNVSFNERMKECLTEPIEVVLDIIFMGTISVPIQDFDRYIMN